MADAATAVIEQQLEIARKELRDLQGKFEQFKMIAYLIALQSGMDWKDLCKRAEARMQAQQRVKMQRQQQEAKAD